MQVFKNYFRLLKKRSSTILIYFGIFIVISIMIASFYSKPENNVFNTSKTDTVFINNDKDTLLTKSMYSYLEKTCNFVDFSGRNINFVKDAVFYEEIDYVIIIPENFTEDFLSGKDVSIEKIYSVSDADADYVDFAINNYLATTSLFFSDSGSSTDEELFKLIDNSLDASVKTTVISENKEYGKYDFFATYLNYFVYILTAVFIIIITLIMTSYNKLNIKRRNIVSPITLKQMQSQLISANIIFAVISTAILIFIGMLISGDIFIDKTIFLLILNTFCFALCALGIAFFISQFGLKHEINIALSNVVSLSFSFLCGAFVPQSILSDSIINFSKFLPAYWFINTNNILAGAGSLSENVINQSLKSMGVLLLFTISIFILTMVVAKTSRRKEN